MNRKEKIQAAMKLAKSVKFSGLAGIAFTGLITPFARKERYEKDLDGIEPMFRYAACDDLFTLMARHPQYCRFDRDSDRSPAYGLKSTGTIFCADRIDRMKPARILEVGAGWNRDFDDHSAASWNTGWWMIHPRLAATRGASTNSSDR